MMTKPHTAQRFQTQEPARVEVYGKTDAFLCKLSNLSTSGALLEVLSSTYTPQVGDLICVTVSLRNLNKTHVLNGEVIWCKDQNMGVAFINHKTLLQKLAG